MYHANKNYESKSRGLSVLVLGFLILHEMFLDPSQLLLGWDIVDWCLRVFDQIATWRVDCWIIYCDGLSKIVWEHETWSAEFAWFHT